MPYAYLYIPETKKYKIVNTNDLIKFSVKDYDSDNDECKKSIYRLKLPNGKKQNCQVLKTRNTKVALEEIVNSKRLTVPKLNMSNVYDEHSSSENEDMLANERKKRKIDKGLKERAAKETNLSIIAAHVKARKNNAIDDAPGQNKKLHISQEKSHNSEDETEETMQQSDFEQVEQSDNELGTMTKEVLMQNLEKEKELSEEWRAKYYKLKESGGYLLTEKTGKEIIDNLKKIANRSVIAGDNDDNGSLETNEQSEVGIIRDQKICIGSKVWVPTIVYDELMRETEPSKFITNASYAIWGAETLSGRCVRAQTNVAEPELTPTKKSAILKTFEGWMRNKRMMPQHLIDEQMCRKKYNKLFNGAITAARKKCGYITLKSKLQEEEKVKDSLQKKPSIEDDANELKRKKSYSRSESTSDDWAPKGSVGRVEGTPPKIDDRRKSKLKESGNFIQKKPT